MKKYVKSAKNSEVTLEDIRDVVEELGWSFREYDDYVMVENWTDVAGQDIFFETNSKDPAEVIDEIIDYASNYDVDDEFDVYNEYRGKNGVPSSARALLEDLENAQEMWDELAEALGKLR